MNHAIDNILTLRDMDLRLDLDRIAHFHPPVVTTHSNSGHGHTESHPHSQSDDVSDESVTHYYNGTVHSAGQETEHNHQHADEQHSTSGTSITAPITLVLAGLVMLLAVAVIGRTVWMMRRDKDKQGRGVRRLRGMLVVSLLLADFVVALSSIGPAAMIFHNLSLSGYQCGPSGLTLALGLWWQYLSSLLVGIVTFLSLRRPLSRALRHLEHRPWVLLSTLFLLGIIPAGLWYALHGYSGCHGFCFYGLPSDIRAEVMQFVPRLIVSGAIMAMYVPVIAFLQCPDMGGAYLPSTPLPGHENGGQGGSGLGRARSRSRSRSGSPEDGQEDIPPWERLSFPNFQFSDSDYTFPSNGSGLGGGGSPATTLRTFASTSGLLGASKRDSRGTKGDDALSGHARSTTTGSDFLSVTYNEPRRPRPTRGHVRSETLPSAAILISSPLADQGSLVIESPLIRQSPSPTPSPISSFTPPPPVTVTKSRAGRLRPHTSTGASPSRFSTGSGRFAPAGISQGVEEEDEGPRVSFTAMLDLAPIPARQVRAVSATPGRSRASTLVNSAYSVKSGLEKVDAIKGLGLGFDLNDYHQQNRDRAASFDTQATAVEMGVEMSKGSSMDGSTGMADLVPGVLGQRRGSAGTTGSEGIYHSGARHEMVETMDSVRRRRTRVYLLWFPLTHFVLCAFTIARFAYFAISKHDGPVVDFLTLIVIMGQGLADVMIFGIVEHRTKELYRREADACHLGAGGEIGFVLDDREMGYEEDVARNLGQVDLPVQRRP